ncbi:meteorin-like protein isoform X2 [Rhinatrema bivittatum]|uniref:meteorin-like protein isoform X2 n=1 Tax=Rhinatrema bivittatum TaxID=194408 RepID=UPI00112EC54C|nr:meteorin-like protein isoform X2 [Rhinatrema bivittatum]
MQAMVARSGVDVATENFAITTRPRKKKRFLLPRSRPVPAPHLMLSFAFFVLPCSGLSAEPRSRTVEQVRLRCTEGSLEWLYPARALRVLLEPHLASGPTTVCIKPARGFRGANVYVERTGQLLLLVNEADDEARLQQVRCFGSEQPRRVALFLQASPQLDLGRRAVAFQYELLSGQGQAPERQQIALAEAMCRPCDDTELLMAICSSDFERREGVASSSPQRRNSISHRKNAIYPTNTKLASSSPKRSKFALSTPLLAC